MLKWSVLKPVNGWEEDSSVNIVKQLLQAKSDVTSIVPCLVKVKLVEESPSNSPLNLLVPQPPESFIPTKDKSTENGPTKNSSSTSLHASTHSKKSSSGSSTPHTTSQTDKDDIWMILQKSTANYAIATPTDSALNCFGKRFAIPFDYDGLFAPIINNKASLKYYKCVKDMEGDIQRHSKIILAQSCIGFGYYEAETGIKSTAKTNQYRVHKIEEGTVLRFEKFCYIETNKCESSSATTEPQNEMPSNNSEIVEFNTARSNASHKTTLSKRSIFSNIFSSILSSSNGSTGSTGATNTIKSSHSAMAKSTPVATNPTCFCTGIKSLYGGANPASLSPSYTTRRQNDNAEDQATLNRNKNKKSKIIRVIKCYEVDSNSIVYIKDSTNGDFLIDNSSTENTENKPTEISCKFLYDLKTLLGSRLAVLPSDQVEFELVFKKSTKFNRLPFNRIRLLKNNNDNLLINQMQSIIIYDVNKNKFFEHLLLDLLNLDNVKFFKASKDSDLLAKYKAKLEWCMATLNEFKADVKVIFDLPKPKQETTGQFFGIYLEQYLFRTYSRRNFRRRTNVSASLPSNIKNKSNSHPSILNDSPFKNAAEANEAEKETSQSRNEMYMRKTDTILQHKNFANPETPKKNLRVTINDAQPELLGPASEKSDAKENRFKKIMKFATTTARNKTKLTMPIPESFKKGSAAAPSNLQNSSSEDFSSSKTVTETIRSRISSIIPDVFVSTGRESSGSEASLKNASSSEVAPEKGLVTVINITRKSEGASEESESKPSKNDKFEYNIKYLNKKAYARPSLFGSLSKSPTSFAVSDSQEEIAKANGTSSRKNSIFGKMSGSLSGSTGGESKSFIHNLFHAGKQNGANTMKGVFSEKFENKNVEITAI